MNKEFARELNLLILKTRMTFRQTIQRLLKRHNIDMNFEMLQIMNCLWKEEGVSQQILAEKTAKDKACLTNLINNLEKKGWVVRKAGTSDRRNKLVYLTEEGKELSIKVMPLLMDVYEEVGDQLGIKQIEAIMNRLRKLNDILEQL